MGLRAAEQLFIFFCIEADEGRKVSERYATEDRTIHACIGEPSQGTHVH